MSRIGKAPVEIADKVEVSIEPSAAGTKVTVKGPLGTLTRVFRPEVEFSKEGNTIVVKPKNDDRQSRSLHGLSRTLLNNMIIGVSAGFVKNLEIVGVGYRASVQGANLGLQLGYSHPLEVPAPPNVTFKVDGNTKVEIKGIDKQVVGDVAALIRSYRPPEPYKGKGVKYAGERIRRKAGKAGKK